MMNWAIFFCKCSALAGVAFLFSLPLASSWFSSALAAAVVVAAASVSWDFYHVRRLSKTLPRSSGFGKLHLTATCLQDPKKKMPHGVTVAAVTSFCCSGFGIARWRKHIEHEQVVAFEIEVTMIIVSLVHTWRRQWVSHTLFWMPLPPFVRHSTSSKRVTLLLLLMLLLLLLLALDNSQGSSWSIIEN